MGAAPSKRAPNRKVMVKESTGERILLQSRLRLLTISLFFFLCFASIGGRLVAMMIQSPNTGTPAKKVEDASQEPEDAEVNVSETLRRGNIVDRNGIVVATSLMTESAFANPKEIKDLGTAAEKLEKVVGIPKATLLKRMSGNKSFVWIKRHLTPKEQQAVNNLGIPGVYFLPEERRVYPYGNLLAHVVGYVGVDNKGLAGMEKSFDQQLLDNYASRDALKLSVDLRVQHILRDEMKKSIDEFRAIGATGVVLDVKTGEVVAMSSLPDFDANRASQAKDEQKFNRAALGIYEMGSTFKTFTIAMALDKGTTTMKGGYDATNPLKFASFTISDSHPKRRWLSIPEIYAYSSNIGMARMALDAGTKTQQDFMKRIGMLSPVDIELPEKPQPLYPKDWKEINAITISYGHGISVSPLHLVRGIATLVGDGTLEKLTLIKGGNDGKPRGERVIKKDTAEQMRRLMRIVVRHGTGSKADVPGYMVGGKTGTAEKVQSGGTYNKDNKIASFVATFPMNDPKYVVLVMVDEPKPTKASYGFATGGWVAAPAVGNIIARMASVYGIAPQFTGSGDDADKYWVDTEKKTATQVAAPKPVFQPRFLHVASY